MIWLAYTNRYRYFSVIFNSTARFEDDENQMRKLKGEYFGGKRVFWPKNVVNKPQTIIGEYRLFIEYRLSDFQAANKGESSGDRGVSK